MTKNGHQKFWRMKTENSFWEKSQIGNILRNRGENLKQREMHHCLMGDGRLCLPASVVLDHQQFRTRLYSSEVLQDTHVPHCIIRF